MYAPLLNENTKQWQNLDLALQHISLVNRDLWPDMKVSRNLIESKWTELQFNRKYFHQSESPLLIKESFDVSKLTLPVSPSVTGRQMGILICYGWERWSKMTSKDLRCTLCKQTWCIHTHPWKETLQQRKNAWVQNDVARSPYLGNKSIVLGNLDAHQSPQSNLDREASFLSLFFADILMCQS